MKAVERAAGDRFDARAVGGTPRRRLRLVRARSDRARPGALVEVGPQGGAGARSPSHGACRRVPAAALGQARTNAAVVRRGGRRGAGPPPVRADRGTADHEGTLSGTKTLVRAGMAADALLVTATGPDGVGVYLVDPASAAIDRQRAAHQRRRPVRRSSPSPHRSRPSSSAPTRVGASAELLTVCCRGRTARRDRGRARADRVVRARPASSSDARSASFQAVSAASRRRIHRRPRPAAHRSGRPVWRLQEGLPASTEVAVAKLWAADAGHRLAHTTVARARRRRHRPRR